MPDARIIEVCDAAVDLIVAALDNPTDATVSREYLPDVDAETITDRLVYVFPDGYSQVETNTRSQDLDEYRVVVLTVERYESAGTPPKAWIDARVLFVQQKIYETLSDARTVRLLDTIWPEVAEVTVAYDPEELRERKLFWSEAVFTFRELV